MNNSSSSVTQSASGGLLWISTRHLSHFQRRSDSLQVVLYSSGQCGLCRHKLVPLFLELAAWSPEQWRRLGYLAGAPLLFNAIDTRSNSRPTQPVARDVASVPCVQLWAPAASGYAPKEFCDSAYRRLDYAGLRASLANWIVQYANQL